MEVHKEQPPKWESRRRDQAETRAEAEPLHITAARLRQLRKRRAAGEYPPSHKPFDAEVLPRPPAVTRVQPENPDPIALVDGARSHGHIVLDGSPCDKHHCGRAYSGHAHVVLVSLHF